MDGCGEKNMERVGHDYCCFVLNTGNFRAKIDGAQHHARRATFRLKWQNAKRPLALLFYGAVCGLTDFEKDLVERIQLFV